MENKDTNFSVRVRSADKEIEIQIPLENRSVIGMGSDGTGKAAIDVVKQLIKELNNID
jgi:hypothetical protein